MRSERSELTALYPLPVNCLVTRLIFSIHYQRKPLKKYSNMTLRFLPVAVIALVTIALPCAAPLAQVLPPKTPKVPLSLPSNPPPLDPVDDPAARSRIADSLKPDAAPKLNGANGNRTANTTGDPILDDVLGIIRRQGSILDGSVLDPAAADDRYDSVLPNSRRSDGANSESLSGDSVYDVAEQLLRVARMLQRLPGRDAERDELAHAMRGQATKLMIDGISHESKASSPDVNPLP